MHFLTSEPCALGQNCSSPSAYTHYLCFKYLPNFHLEPFLSSDLYISILSCLMDYSSWTSDSYLKPDMTHTELFISLPKPASSQAFSVSGNGNSHCYLLRLKPLSHLLANYISLSWNLTTSHHLHCNHTVHVTVTSYLD